MTPLYKLYILFAIPPYPYGLLGSQKTSGGIMARPKKIWVHKKKFGMKRKFEGNYRYFRGDRIFELTSKSRVISFESPKAALNLGWTAK